MPPRPPALHLAKLPPLLGAAAADLRNGFWEPAASRMYYACLHAALALLSTVGLSPGTHRGAREMFGLHFVKDGPLAAEVGRALTALATERETADYSVTAVPAPEVARAAAAAAEAFLAAALAEIGDRAPETREGARAALDALDGLARAAAEIG